MATGIQISCINRDDRHNACKRITHVRSIDSNQRWKLKLDNAIKDIENGTYSFYTSVIGHIRKVVVATRLGKNTSRRKQMMTHPITCLAYLNAINLNDCPVCGQSFHL